MEYQCVCTHTAREHNHLGICTVLACGCRDFTTPVGTCADDDTVLARAVGVMAPGGVR